MMYTNFWTFEIYLLIFDLTRIKKWAHSLSLSIEKFGRLILLIKSNYFNSYNLKKRLTFGKFL